MEKEHIILASNSPRRQELLQKITSNFIVDASSIEEEIPTTIEAIEAPRYLSEKKAQAMRPSYPKSIIIGCDTIVFAGGETLGKPHNYEEALHMLELLNDSTHQVITGCTVLFPTGDKKSVAISTDVSFDRMSHQEMDAYIHTGESFDKAGGYGIQGLAAKFITGICGDYYSVMGLPVSWLYQTLKESL